MRGPNQSHGTCKCPSYTEAKDHSRYDKLPATTEIELEDGHVRGRTQHKENQEHRGDGAIKARGGLSSQARGLWGIRRMLGICLGRADISLWSNQ